MSRPIPLPRPLDVRPRARVLGEPATPTPATTDVEPGAAKPEKKWDGVQRDTLVNGELPTSTT